MIQKISCEQFRVRTAAVSESLIPLRERMLSINRELSELVSRMKPLKKIIIESTTHTQTPNGWKILDGWSKSKKAKNQWSPLNTQHIKLGHKKSSVQRDINRLVTHKNDLEHELRIQESKVLAE